MCINFSGTLDSDPEAVVSVSGCKVGFCLLSRECIKLIKTLNYAKSRMKCIYLRMYCTEIFEDRDAVYQL